MLSLVLYGTQGCHLCETALQVVAWTLEGQDWTLDEIDIAADDRLIEKYGVRIPVLALAAAGPGEHCAPEIGWPFAPDDLVAWLNQHAPQVGRECELGVARREVL